eukprot:942756-Amphidinium_carterae.1
MGNFVWGRIRLCTISVCFFSSDGLHCPEEGVPPHAFDQRAAVRASPNTVKELCKEHWVSTLAELAIVCTNLVTLEMFVVVR